MSQTIKNAWNSSSVGRLLKLGALGTTIDDIITAVNKCIVYRNYHVLTPPGLAIGTSSKAKIKVVTACAVTKAGVIVKVAAATEVAFTATTHDLVANTDCYYTLSVSDTDTVTITKGTPVAHGSTPVRPAAPAGETIIGYVRIHAATGAIFDATTTELDALGAGGSITYEDADAEITTGLPWTALTQLTARNIN